MLKKHPVASILFRPPDHNSPNFQQAMLEFQDLAFIEKKLAEVDYQSSFQLVNEVRQLVFKNSRFISQDIETAKSLKDFKDYLEALSKEVENLPLKEFVPKRESTDSSSNKDLRKGSLEQINKSGLVGVAGTRSSQ